jgi:hypothetical protein
LKNNSENFRKKTSQHTDMPHHLSLLKIIMKTLEKCIITH